MNILFDIIRVICMGAVYFVLGALLLGSTCSVMLLAVFLWSLVIDSWKREYQEKHVESSDEYERLHAEISAFLAQMQREG